MLEKLREASKAYEGSKIKTVDIEVVKGVKEIHINDDSYDLVTDINKNGIKCTSHATGNNKDEVIYNIIDKNPGITSYIRIRLYRIKPSRIILKNGSRNVYLELLGSIGTYVESLDKRCISIEGDTLPVNLYGVYVPNGEVGIRANNSQHKVNLLGDIEANNVHLYVHDRYCNIDHSIKVICHNNGGLYFAFKDTNKKFAPIILIAPKGLDINFDGKTDSLDNIIVMCKSNSDLMFRCMKEGIKFRCLDLDDFGNSKMETLNRNASAFGVEANHSLHTKIIEDLKAENQKKLEYKDICSTFEPMTENPVTLKSEYGGLSIKNSFNKAQFNVLVNFLLRICKSYTSKALNLKSDIIDKDVFSRLNGNYKVRLDIRIYGVNSNNNYCSFAYIKASRVRGRETSNYVLILDEDSRLLKFLQLPNDVSLTVPYNITRNNGSVLNSILKYQDTFNTYLRYSRADINTDTDAFIHTEYQNSFKIEDNKYNLIIEPFDNSGVKIFKNNDNIITKTDITVGQYIKRIVEDWKAEE